MEKICGNCIHFDLCESEFSFSNAKPNDKACDDFVEDDGYSDEIYKRGEWIANSTNRDYNSTEVKLNEQNYGKKNPNNQMPKMPLKQKHYCK